MVLLTFVVLATLVAMPAPSPAFGIASLLDNAFPGVGDTRYDDTVVDTLARDLLDQHADARALLRAHQELRTDVGSDPSGSDLLRRALARALRTRLDGIPDVRIRVLQPALHWMESIHKPNGIRIHGESLTVALLETGRRHVAILLLHRSVDREWTPCRRGLCMHSRSEPVRRRGRYELAFPARRTLRPTIGRTRTALRRQLPLGVSLQIFPTRDESRLFATDCAPLPSSITYGFDDPDSPRLIVSHRVDEIRDGTLNAILCGPLASSEADVASVTYTVEGDLARPPSTSTHAVFRNPHGFRLP